MPTSSPLKLGYLSAQLILAMRQLDVIGENLRSQALICGNASQEGQAESVPSEEATEPNTNLKKKLRSRCSKLAEMIIGNYLEMTPTSRISLTTEIHLCVAYCVLILAHYDEVQSGISDEHCMNLVLRVLEWYRGAPQYSRLVKFGDLAQRKLRSRSERVAIKKSDSSVLDPWHNTPHNIVNETPEDSEWHLTPLKPVEELSFDIEIPSLQEFFGGGFLDFDDYEPSGHSP